MSKRIGIIGQGFVGNSIRAGMVNDYPDLLTFDLRPELSNCASLDELVEKCGVIFVCVPTPMQSDGKCYTGILEGVINDILAVVQQKILDERILVLKTTIPPGTTQMLQEKYGELKFVFNPEFLTEANAVNDFKNQNRIVLGANGPESDRVLNEVSGLYKKSFPFIPIVKMTSQEAEMVKYVTNTFLATKVIFANEMYQICQALGINYENVYKAAKLDTRLGESHWKVPGPDGDFGFGGHCVLGECGVLTPNGIIEIKDLSEGDKVYSTDYKLSCRNVKTVLKKLSRDYAGDIVTISTNRGELVCTSDHLVPVKRDGRMILLKAGKIVKSDGLFVHNSELLPEEEIEIVNINDITSNHFSGTVFNIEVSTLEEDDDLYWINENGIVSHNCFPKDTNAIIYLAESKWVNPKLLKTVIEKNNDIRKNRDWEGQKGRAVI